MNSIDQLHQIFTSFAGNDSDQQISAQVLNEEFFKKAMGQSAASKHNYMANKNLNQTNRLDSKAMVARAPKLRLTNHQESSQVLKSE